MCIQIIPALCEIFRKQCDVTWPEPITERRRQRLIMHACIFGQRFNPPTALLNGVKYREILSAILPIPIEHLPRVENDDKFCQFHACSLTFKEIRRIGRILDFYRNFLVSVFGLISIFIKKKTHKKHQISQLYVKKINRSYQFVILHCKFSLKKNKNDFVMLVSLK